MKNILKLMAAFSIFCFFPLALSQPSVSFWRENEIVKASFSKSVCRETADILRNFPGIWAKQLGSREFGQSVALWNGFEIADPWTGLTDINWIPDAWIDSVTVYPALSPQPYRPIRAFRDTPLHVSIMIKTVSVMEELS
jgi:hypothetical protein